MAFFIIKAFSYFLINVNCKKGNAKFFNEGTTYWDDPFCRLAFTEQTSS